MAPMLPMEMIRKSFQSWYYWFPMLMYGFLGALSTYNTAWYEMDKMADKFKATYLDARDRFDFIIGKRLKSQKIRNTIVFIIYVWHVPLSWGRLSRFCCCESFIEAL